MAIENKFRAARPFLKMNLLNEIATLFRVRLVRSRQPRQLSRISRGLAVEVVEVW